MIKVLHTLPALDGGGAEKIVYDYCIRMMDEYQFDFVVHTDYKGILEEDLEKRGCKIFHVPPLRKDRVEYKKRINEIIKSENYDIIHVSQGYRGAYFCWIAKKYNIPVRIAHSHMAFIPESFVEKLKRVIATAIVKICATDLFACGIDAGRWMWGKRKTFIMTNAIDSDSFKFNIELRKSIRKDLNIEDKLVIGNVARFSYQKNHEFLIDIAKEVVSRRKDVIFLLIGRGELEEMIREKVVKAGLDSHFVFMGVRKDVPKLLNAMDVFILPSRFEGLPVTLVEAQANGLYVLASDRITKEIKYAQNMKYISIDDGCDKWVEWICNAEEQHSQNNILLTDYDINIAVNNVRNKYSELLGL